MFEGDREISLKSLKLPSKNSFRVTEISGLDKNQYLVLEVSDWVAVSADVLKKLGKFKKGISTARPFVCGNWDSYELNKTYSRNY